ncbi:FAD/NAD(P)-binding domain-containing protein [Choiromyces venosus 120613-1]|uniref:FAD/NAD(P)-binding domain-containing protein n=1 Tax=Choiromyces venosus 120613-1 TaxID=1336337 RepID=A0A3N4J688_9PEZI|nr:FAD/NAD(P)-binding domain-containing protein [Choiromyces venosus 120613-1]
MSTKVIVIGAGWFGLIAAKTYLQVEPNVDLTILESEETVGGTWSRARVHPNLLAQQRYGRYEYSDRKVEIEGGDRDAFIPALKLHAYMNEYAEDFGIKQRIRFKTTVNRIARNEDGKRWDVWVNDDSELMTCDRLIVATGLTSKPIMPNTPSEKSTAKIFHSKELGTEYDYVTSPAVKNVTVYGGGKSAIDALYSCVTNGKNVNWIVRKGGGGVPPLLTGVINGQNLDDFAVSRFASKLHPNLHTNDWWHWALHSGKNFLGQWLHWKYWERTTDTMQSNGEYTKSENMAKLAPNIVDHGAYWLNVGPAVLTQPDILDWIHRGDLVTVHRNTIEKVEGNQVYLDDGSSHRADVVIYATGYDVIQPAFSPEDSAHLGLPILVKQCPPEIIAKWDHLEEIADKEVVKRFPRLGKPPPHKRIPVAHTPYRLWRNMVPLPLLAGEELDRSLVFVGTVKPFSTPIMSEAMALWTVAWMTGRIHPRKSFAEMEHEVAITNAFARRRYLNLGYKFSYQLFEFLPIVDHLLQETGVKSQRKAGAFADFFEPYLPEDYRGMIEEFKKIHGISNNEEIKEEK